MRAKHFGFLILAGFLITPTLLWSQGPGGMQMKGGRDPEQLFNMFSGGADVIKISAVPEPGQTLLRNIASQAGVQGDTITRDQFRQGRQANDMQFGNRRNGGPGGPAAGPGGPGGAPGMMFGRGGPQGGGDPRQMEIEAHNQFLQLDTNHDNFISHEEADRSPKLKENHVFEAFDTDKDGKLNFEEFKAYYIASKAHDQKQPDVLDEDVRPTIFRAGKLPKELPPWFGEIDKKGDNDGQVGLDEWAKYSSKKIDEFLVMDLNNDGVLTAEEYLKFHKHQEELAKNDPAGATLAQMGQDDPNIGAMMGGMRGGPGGGMIGGGGGMRGGPGGGMIGGGGGMRGGPGGGMMGGGGGMRGGPGGGMIGGGGMRGGMGGGWRGGGDQGGGRQRGGQ
jgi:Ca2+-binding EF-hand superfamily protein